MSVLFIFIDGVGVGQKSEFNPLANRSLKSFSYFTEGEGLHNGIQPSFNSDKLYLPIDANLDVEGLPQSGTGQASLFSGENASKIAGKHYGPFPYSKTKFLLKEKSLFQKAQNEGFKPHFLNAYPDIFFQKSKKRNRWTCTTLMAKSAGIELNGLEALLDNKAMTAEIIQNAWRNSLNLDVPIITPEDGAQRALNSLGEYDLVLYEYYLTDKAGHEKDSEKANKVLGVLDRFLVEIIENLKDGDTLVISSDHGNIEDLSTKTHTRNPVALFVKGDTYAFKNATSILDVTPGIIETLKRGRK
ncbi:MAG: alkaline phosphatase family protein [Bacteroidota bacterium]